MMAGADDTTKLWRPPSFIKKFLSPLLMLTYVVDILTKIVESFVLKNATVGNA